MKTSVRLHRGDRKKSSCTRIWIDSRDGYGKIVFILGGHRCGNQTKNISIHLQCAELFACFLLSRDYGSKSTFDGQLFWETFDKAEHSCPDFVHWSAERSGTKTVGISGRESKIAHRNRRKCRDHSSITYPPDTALSERIFSCWFLAPIDFVYVYNEKCTSIPIEPLYSTSFSNTTPQI